MKTVMHAVVAALLVAAGGAAAAGYPERPVTIVVGFQAGGNVDLASFAAFIAPSA